MPAGRSPRQDPKEVSAAQTAQSGRPSSPRKPSDYGRGLHCPEGPRLCVPERSGPRNAAQNRRQRGGGSKKPGGLQTRCHPGRDRESVLSPKA